MKLISSGFLLAAGLATCAAAPNPTRWAADDRPEVLEKFFAKYRSPLAAHATAFVAAADRYGLDWRLMPSLVILESGGRNLRNNNVFGWGNGYSRFPSVRDSVWTVAEILANRDPYRGKTLQGKMKAYNPRRRDYCNRVMRVMATISPEFIIDPPTLLTAVLQ